MNNNPRTGEASRFAAALSIPIALLLFQPGGAQETAAILIDPKVKRHSVSPEIYGTNHRFHQNGILTWDTVNLRMDPKFDAHHRKAGLKSIRYPGGTTASTLEWKKAIGPVASRPRIQPAISHSQIAHFGVDENARWCEANKVAMTYMYGIGAPNSNPQDAADLVEYLNSPVGANPNGGIDWARKRADNGHPAPYNVRFFEVGNEADGPGEDQRLWIGRIDSEATRAKLRLSLQDQRDAYAPEFAFGGMVKLVDAALVEEGNFDSSTVAVSDGKPDQRKLIRYYPIEAGSDQVFVGGEAWQRVADLGQSRGKVYQVDAMTGTVLFGDGAHGDIPPKGARLSVTFRAHRHGFVDYYAAMKAVDPGIRIYAGYESPNLITTLGSRHPYDGLVVHPYTNQWNVPKAASLADWHQNAMLSSVRLADVISAYQDLVDATVAPARRGLVKVVCTEYGLNRQNLVMPPGGEGAGQATLSAGLYTGLQLLGFMKTGMPMAQMHATTPGVFGSAPDFVPGGAALAFELLTQRFGSTLIGIKTSNIPARQTDRVFTGTPYHGYVKDADNSSVPPGTARRKLPKLVAEASSDSSGSVHVVVINQDAMDAVTADIEIAGGFVPHDADVWTLNGPEVGSTPSTDSLDVLRIGKKQVQHANGKLRHLFPAHSITAIRFPGKDPTRAIGSKGAGPGFKVFTRPSSGGSEVAALSLPQAAKFGIFNARGTLVRSGHLPAGKSEIDLGGFPKGLYVLEIQVDGYDGFLAYLPNF